MCRVLHTQVWALDVFHLCCAAAPVRSLRVPATASQGWYDGVFRCTRSLAPSVVEKADEREVSLDGRPLEAAARAIRESSVGVMACVKGVGVTAYGNTEVYHMRNDLSAEAAVCAVAANSGGVVYVVGRESLPYSVMVNGWGRHGCVLGCAPSTKGVGVVGTAPTRFIHIRASLQEAHSVVRGVRTDAAGSAVWARKAAAEYMVAERFISKPWRGQGWRAATGDDFAKEARSTEFGWSTFPGGSMKQQAARAKGGAYKLASWEHPLGAQFFKRHLRAVLRSAWAACVQEDQATCERTLAAVAPRYRLEGTGFTKVTVSLNNPTPVHTDYGNIGLTFLMAHDVSDADEPPLQGGSHIMLDPDMRAVIVVEDHADGVFLIGDYANVLHANLASTSGRRFVVTCYSNAFPAA